MLSPVWTPIGSRFSMLQMVMQVPAPSRITSYSISFHPTSDRSRSTWWIGLALSPLSNDAFQFRVGRCHAAACAAQRVGRSYDQRQWDIRCKLECLIDRRDDRAVDDRLSNAIQEISKQRAVFCLLDGGKRRAQQANAVSFEDPAIRDLNRQVESRLTSQGRKQPVGAFPLDNSLHDIRCQWLQIDGVRDAFIGHDRGWVGVDQDGAHPLFTEGTAGLGAGVVKLSRLSNDDRPRTENQNALDRS